MGLPYEEPVAGAAYGCGFACMLSSSARRNHRYTHTYKYTRTHTHIHRERESARARRKWEKVEEGEGEGDVHAGVFCFSANGRVLNALTFCRAVYGEIPHAQSSDAVYDDIGRRCAPHLTWPSLV